MAWKVSIFSCCSNHCRTRRSHKHNDSYVPYKYATEKFINVSVVDRDQSDPTVYCLLTAKSKIPGVSISEVCIFTPRWSVTTNSFRPPVSRFGETPFSQDGVMLTTLSAVLPPQHGDGGHGYHLWAVRRFKP